MTTSGSGLCAGSSAGAWSLVRSNANSVSSYAASIDVGPVLVLDDNVLHLLLVLRHCETMATFLVKIKSSKKTEMIVFGTKNFRTEAIFNRGAIE